jgi:putative hydrolase of the HAD superfamily
MSRALLLDLDDTLYDYLPNEQNGRAAVFSAICSDTGISGERARELYDRARKQVKARVGNTGCSHSRLLYLIEVAHTCGVPGAIAHARGWERAFWRAYLSRAQLRTGARELLSGWRAQGNKVAIVTDLVAEVQLWKLEQFGLFELIDALVVSEEVALDKPALAAFELAMQRLGVQREQCLVVGDSLKKDGGGAEALGIPYYRVRGTEAGNAEGMTLIEVARALGVN